MGNANTWFADTFLNELQPQASMERVLERILNPYEDISYRVPFMFTSDLRKMNKIPPVRLKVNPSSVHFTQAKRITRKDTQAGAVFFHWTNAKGRNNDVINISFEGQTGNINLRTGAQRQHWASDFVVQFQDWVKSITKQEGLEVSTISGAAHLMSFWSLYNLTREPMVDPLTGMPNQFHIMYSSPLLGNAMIDFVGHFDKVLDFSEDASNPFNASYSFSFVASASVPSMDDVYKYLSAALGRQFFPELEEPT